MSYRWTIPQPKGIYDASTTPARCGAETLA